AVPELDDPGHADEGHTGPEADAPEDGRPRQDEDVQLLVLLDQRVGDGAAAPEVAEPERVVAVDEDAIGGELRSRRAAVGDQGLSPSSWGRSFHCPPSRGRAAGPEPRPARRAIEVRGPAGWPGAGGEGPPSAPTRLSETRPKGKPHRGRSRAGLARVRGGASGLPDRVGGGS